MPDGPLSPEEVEASGSAAGIEVLRDLQRRFDASNWTSSAETNQKRRHIGFHLTIAAAKLARCEERFDHGELTPEAALGEVAADLLVYALQLADLLEEDLDQLYRSRLIGLLKGGANHSSFGGTNVTGSTRS